MSGCNPRALPSQLRTCQVFPSSPRGTSDIFRTRCSQTLPAPPSLGWTPPSSTRPRWHPCGCWTLPGSSFQGTTRRCSSSQDRHWGKCHQFSIILILFIEIIISYNVKQVSNGFSSKIFYVYLRWSTWLWISQDWQKAYLSLRRSWVSKKSALK